MKAVNQNSNSLPEDLEHQEALEEIAGCISSRVEYLEQKVSLRTCRKVDRILHWLDDKIINFKDSSVHIKVKTDWQPGHQEKKIREDISKKIGLPVHLDWEVIEKAPSRKSHKNSKRRFNQQKITDEIFRTAPKGAVVTKVLFGGPAPRNSEFHFAIVRVATHQVKEEELESWQARLMEQFKVCVHLNQISEKARPTRQLKKYADKDLILRDHEKIPNISTLIHTMKPPTISANDSIIEPPGPYRDLRHLPFISIDGAGCKDPEDIAFAEKLPNGNIGIYNGISNVARIIPKDSKRAEYVELAGHTIYGNFQAIHNIGELYKETSFLEDEERWAFISYGEINPGGDIVKRDFYSAQVVNHEQMSYEEGERRISERSDNRLNTLNEAVYKLRASRLATSTYLDFGRGRGINRLIEELAIFTYHQAALTFRENETPVLYRNHSVPSRVRIGSLIRKANREGISAKKNDFKEPIRFRRLLRDLQDEGHYGLVREIIDTYLTRGRYQLTNWGHHALSLECYTPLKARKFAGWVNQIQATHMIASTPGFSREEILKLQGIANRKERAANKQTYRLLVFEEIDYWLKRKNKVLNVVLNGKNEEGYHTIDMPQLVSKAILLDKSETYQTGSKIKVKLDGVSTQNGYFLYNAT